jgi:hypothetical protein
MLENSEVRRAISAQKIWFLEQYLNPNPTYGKQRNRLKSYIEYRRLIKEAVKMQAIEPLASHSPCETNIESEGERRT